MKCTIYVFTNLVNGKKYIGSTINSPEKRYSQHIYNATHENTHQYNYPLYQAIRKYGIDNFKFDILFQKECSEEEIREEECKYIIQYNTLSPNGYNQTYDTKHPINDINAYKKMSETKREKAKKVAEVDTNNNIIKIWRSIIDCAEQECLDEKKIAAICRGEIKTTHGRTFYWLDDNNNLIIPVYNPKQYTQYKGEKGTTQNQITNRKVAKIDPKTQEIIEIYDSIALAARENNCDNSAISKVCRGLRKTCGKYIWKYLDN